MVSLPASLNEAALVSALFIVIGVVGYGFLGSMIPSFSYSQYILPLAGIGAVAFGMHLEGPIGDVVVGFGAALAGSGIKTLIPSSA